jgi:D-sedoheptulose 7-phosphate isomerase
MTAEHPVHAHLRSLRRALEGLALEALTLERWGRELAALLEGGGRLLVAGNGGSAAEAQHLTAEIVGRYRDDRPPYSAIALHADTSSLTAIANDYGLADAFARQVHAHGREGDVLLCLSTSGRSENVLAAALAGRERRLRTWALTGPRPNPLANLAHEHIAVHTDLTSTIQEAHLVVVHLLCEAFERHLSLPLDPTGATLAPNVRHSAAGGAA